MTQKKKVALFHLFLKAMDSKNLTINCKLTIYFKINLSSDFLSNKAYCGLGFPLAFQSALLMVGLLHKP